MSNKKFFIIVGVVAFVGFSAGAAFDYFVFGGGKSALNLPIGKKTGDLTYDAQKQDGQNNNQESGQSQTQAAASSSSSKPAQVESFVIEDIKTGNVSKSVSSAKTAGGTSSAEMKAPVGFKSFNYDQKAGKVISVSGNCSDKYYAMLIFKSADDYRKDPAAAVHNRAFVCPAGGRFKEEVDLKNFNLPSGSYYLFVADQGEKDSWYNPR